MIDFLAHPLTILCVGAVVTGLLVPAITRRWQDRQKELELKTELVAELSEAIMSIVLAVQFVRLARDQTPAELLTREVLTERQRQFDEAYRVWEVRSAVIGTKLEAYFAGTQIPQNWSDFTDAVTAFYALEGQDAETQARSVADLAGLLTKLGGRATPDWGDVRNGILEVKARIIRSVLDAPVSAFRSRFAL
jgi:hypothetical protein